MPIQELPRLLEEVALDSTNPWFSRVTRITEAAAWRGQDAYNISIAVMEGVLDVMSAFLGPRNLILAMRKRPDLVNACRAIIFEKWHAVFNALHTIIRQYCDGTTNWINVWCPGPWYPVQSDFTAMLSPKWFQFALPDIVAQVEQLDYAIYHLDGPLALKYLDDLLKIDNLTGIQWVPGAGNDPKCSDTWKPVYKKIQAAGKSVVIDYFEQPERLSHFYRELDPRLLFTTIYLLEYYLACFHLPEFVGGQGSEGNYAKFRREARRQFREESAE